MVGCTWKEYDELDPEWPAGILGSGTGASITFKVIGCGKCNLTIYDTHLYDINLGEIPVDVTKGGFFTNYPRAEFTYTPTNPSDNTLVTFNASDSYDPDGYIVSYKWEFGDGNVTIDDDPLEYHSYTNFGTYVVNLTVTDNSSLSTLCQKTITIGWAPTAMFFFTPIDPYLEITEVSFNASGSYDIDGHIDWYVWDFNDTTTVTESDPYTTHKFTVNVTSNILTVTLTVIDDDGFNTTTEETVIVLMPGDATGEGFVDVSDFALLGYYWFNVRGYDRRPDFITDGFIDVSDFAILGKYWFKGAPWYP